MKTTKAGRDSSAAQPPQLLNPIDHQTWRECFAAAIGGTLSAHRGVPNPEIVVGLAATVADRALIECRRRRSKTKARMARLDAIDEESGNHGKTREA